MDVYRTRYFGRHPLDRPHHLLRAARLSDAFAQADLHQALVAFARDACRNRGHRRWRRRVRGRSLNATRRALEPCRARTSPNVPRWTTTASRPASSTGRTRVPTTRFYGFPRLVTHIDDGAIAAVGALYEELGIDGDVLDLMGSWVSHFRRAPRAAHGARHERRRSSPPTRWRPRPSCTTSTPTRGCRSPTTRSTRRCAASRSTTSSGRSRCSPTSRGSLRPGRALRVHVLQPLLPDQGDPGLAAVDRRAALRDRGRVLPARRRLRRADRSSGAPPSAIGATRCTRCGAVVDSARHEGLPAWDSSLPPPRSP